MENEGCGPAQDWLTVQRPAIVQAFERKGPSIRAVTRQVIPLSLGQGRAAPDEDHRRCRLHASRGASVHGIAGRRADAESGHGGDRKAHDGGARALFSRSSVQGLAPDRRHERRLAPGVFKARAPEVLTGTPARGYVLILRRACSCFALPDSRGGSYITNEPRKRGNSIVWARGRCFGTPACAEGVNA